MDALVRSPAVAALAAARRLIAIAEADVADVRRRAAALAAATDWRARAADDYRSSVAGLGDALDALLTSIRCTDGDLAAIERAEVGEALG